MRSIKAMLSSRGPGCTVAELQDDALQAFEDGLLAKEADIRLKLRHNVERIKEVERELVSFRRDMALTSGSKKLALEHLRRRIEAQSERYTEAERRRKEARDAWERAEAEAAKERESHQRMVDDFQMLLDQKSKAQTDRMRELTERLDELSSAADVAGPRGTATSAHNNNNDGGSKTGGWGRSGGGASKKDGRAPSLEPEETLRPPPGFSFADAAATDDAAPASTSQRTGGHDGRRGKEGAAGKNRGGGGGGRNSGGGGGGGGGGGAGGAGTVGGVVDDYLDGGGGWEGDVMFEGGSEGVVAWGALNQGEEERRLKATKEALGSVAKHSAAAGSTKPNSRPNKGGGGGGSGSGGGGGGVGGPDGMKIVMTKSGGFSGVAPGQKSGGGGSYGCTAEHSGSAVVAHDERIGKGNTNRRR